MTVAGSESKPSEVKLTRMMLQTSEDNYINDSGYRMQREYGLSPNGNPINGRWVLRDHAARWIDSDQYRHDLLERHGFAVAQQGRSEQHDCFPQVLNSERFPM